VAAKATVSCMTGSTIATDAGSYSCKVRVREAPNSNHPATMPGGFALFLNLPKQMAEYNLDCLGQERFLPNYFQFYHSTIDDTDSRVKQITEK
jgi:hypothetical protein